MKQYARFHNTSNTFAINYLICIGRSLIMRQKYAASTYLHEQRMEEQQYDYCFSTTDYVSASESSLLPALSKRRSTVVAIRHARTTTIVAWYKQQACKMTLSFRLMVISSFCRYQAGKLALLQITGKPQCIATENSFKKAEISLFGNDQLFR